MGDVLQCLKEDFIKELFGGGFRETGFEEPMTALFLTDETLGEILMKAPADLRDQAVARVRREGSLDKPLIE